MWTAPSSQGVLQCFDQIACVHMSGLFVRSHMNAGQDGFLPPYSPDFNPIEMAFSKLKAFLKKTAARTVDDLWDAIADGIETFTPTECQNYFAAAGYDQA